MIFIPSRKRNYLSMYLVKLSVKYEINYSQKSKTALSSAKANKGSVGTLNNDVHIYMYIVIS